MVIWTTANQKGGVGKTTSAITLAGHQKLRGRRTLLVDLDPHGSLTSYFGLDFDQPRVNVYDLFVAAIDGDGVAVQEAIHKTEFDGIDLIPASVSLATLDRRIGTTKGMGAVLDEALGRLEGDYDCVLVDCPPMLGVLMVNALAACQMLIIPVQTEFLAIKGLERMLHTLRMIDKSLRMSLPYLIVPTFYDRRTRASQVSLEKIRSEYGGKTWNRFVPIDTLFREASRENKPLPLVRPSCRGSIAYGALLDELEVRDGH